MSFSVVIPCYNDGNLLERAVGSVCPQFSADDELIVIDDGSTDCTAQTTADLIEKFAGQSVRYVHQTNQGVASARNNGLQRANREYVIFLDADDELLEGALNSYRDCIRERSPTWMISGHEWRTEEKTITRVPRWRGGNRQLFRKFLSKKIHLGNLSCICISLTLAKRVGFASQLKVCEDLVFLLVLISLFPPEFIPRMNTRVHRRATGSLRGSTSLEELVRLEMYDVLFAHPELPKRYSEFHNLALSRHYHSILRLAWKLRDSESYLIWYRVLIRADPTAALNLKLLWRYLEMRMSNKSNQ